MTRNSWVFLRGLVRQHRHWEDFPARFQAAFPDDRIVLPDLPGNGDLHDHQSCTSIPEMVDAVREQVRAQGVQGPVQLLALSLGGMVGIEWMERYPEEIEHGVLINTSLRGLSRFTERLRRENYLDILKGLLLRSSLEREELILELTSNLRSDRGELVRKWASYAEAQPVSRMNALRQIFAAATYRAPAARPHEHVLLLQSLGDHLVDPVCTTRIAECWRWPLVTHPTAGHDLTLDDPDWVIAQVRRWLKESRAAA
jgi:pimeloyl-ACP methyl ester carboxylesterase